MRVADGPTTAQWQLPTLWDDQADRPLTMDIHNLADGAQSNAPILGDHYAAIYQPFDTGIMTGISPRNERRFT